MQQKNVNLQFFEDHVIISSPYIKWLIEDIKGLVPSHYRIWNNSNKTWSIHAECHNQVETIIDRLYADRHVHTNIHGDRNALKTFSPKYETQTFDILYLGRVYLRNNNEKSAFGWWNDGWNIVFSYPSLANYFGESPKDATNLYEVLGISVTADASAVKKAFRQAAMQWHPDVSKEKDAREQFDAINKAYQTLKDEELRARYDVGIELEKIFNAKSKAKAAQQISNAVFTPRLKCGRFVCNANIVMGRAYVNEILNADYIQDPDTGLYLVSTWADGDKKFTTDWIPYVRGLD